MVGITWYQRSPLGRLTTTIDALFGSIAIDIMGISIDDVENTKVLTGLAKVNSSVSLKVLSELFKAVIIKVVHFQVRLIFIRGQLLFHKAKLSFCNLYS